METKRWLALAAALWLGAALLVFSAGHLRSREDGAGPSPPVPVERSGGGPGSDPTGRLSRGEAPGGPLVLRAVAATPPR